MKPKSLSVEKQHTLHDITINVDLHEHDQRQLSTPVYKSPIQILIDVLEHDVRVKSVELDSAHDHLSHLEKRFSNPNVKIDKTKLQCGNCHFRLQHTKRNCSLGPCEGPQHCRDIEKHDYEKKQVIDAQSSMKV